MILTDDILTGVDKATARQWLARAQDAYNRLSIGEKEVTVEVTGGGQHRSVTFDKTNIAQLTIWIRKLQKAAGYSVPRRRATAVYF